MSNVNSELRGKKPDQCAIYSVSTILMYWAPVVVKSIEIRKEKRTKQPNKENIFTIAQLRKIKA